MAFFDLILRARVEELGRMSRGEPSRPVRGA